MSARGQLRRRRPRPRWPFRACFALGLVLLNLAGCKEHDPRPAEMRTVIQPLIPSVSAFDRWARRLGLADSAFRSEAALNEAAFAPLRQEDRVRAAWIQREGPDSRELRYPEDAPDCPTDGWVRVRTDELGDVHAQERRILVRGEAIDATLVRRSRPAPGGATLHVTTAYGATEGEETEE